MRIVRRVNQAELVEIGNSFGKLKCQGNDEVIKLFQNFAQLINRLNLHTEHESTVNLRRPLCVWWHGRDLKTAVQSNGKIVDILSFLQSSHVMSSSGNHKVLHMVARSHSGMPQVS